MAPNFCALIPPNLLISLLAQVYTAARSPATKGGEGQHGGRPFSCRVEVPGALLEFLPLTLSDSTGLEVVGLDGCLQFRQVNFAGFQAHGPAVKLWLGLPYRSKTGRKETGDYLVM